MLDRHETGLSPRMPCWTNNLNTVPAMCCRPDTLLQRSKSRCFKLVRVPITSRSRHTTCHVLQTRRFAAEVQIKVPQIGECADNQQALTGEHVTAMQAEGGEPGEACICHKKRLQNILHYIYILHAICATCHLCNDQQRFCKARPA